jgi:hypothetical protein
MLAMAAVAVLLMGFSCGDGWASPRNVGSGVSADDNTGLGYLTAPSLSPGHILRPSSIFILPMLDAKGTERIDFDLHWANVWNYKSDQYLIDGEWIRSNIRYSYALKDSLSVGLTLPIIGRTGGFADSTIENFHSAFRLGNANRDTTPRNQSLITVTDGGDTYTVVEGESWGIGDVSAFAVTRITDGSSVCPAVTIQGEVSFPTGDQRELRGMGAPALSVSTVASKRLGKSSFIQFLGAGFQYCDSDDITVIRFRNEQFSGLAGLEYQYSGTFCLLIQYLVSSPVAENYYAFSKPCHEVSAGFKWRVGRNTVMELAVVENVVVFQNSEDIGIHLAFGRSL